jgi:sugar phosphate isomerase/epimerase
MVHFSVSSMFFHEYPLEEVFDFIGETGLDAIEFWPETPDFWVRGQPMQELHACLRNHPELSHNTVHTPILDLNPCSINPGVAGLSSDHAIDSFRLAEAINATVFTFHPGRRTAKRVPSSADFERFDHLIDRMRCVSRGSAVRVAIENMELKVNSLLCTPEGARELLDKEPWLFFTLDVSHAMGVSLDEVIRYIDLCHDRLVNIHLSRSNGPSMHLPVEGSQDIVTVLHALREYRYQGNLTLEIEDRNFDHEYSSEEKCNLLMRELSFMKECIR